MHACLVVLFVTLIWQEPVDGSKVAYTGTKPILRTGLLINGNESLADARGLQINGNESLADARGLQINDNESLADARGLQINGNESLADARGLQINGNESLADARDLQINGNESLVNGGSKSERLNVTTHRSDGGDPLEDNMPLEYSFFRRKKEKGPLPNKPVQWAHCTQLITPFVKKWKNDIKPPKFLSYEHHEVQRIVHLIKINTTQYSNQEVYAMLIQFSKVQFRIYNWDVSAVRYLLNTLIKGKEQSFRQLKRGVKDLVTRWRLDFSNITSLLTYSKIIRPMCLRAPSIDLSTKNPKPDEFVATPKSTTLGRCQSDEYGSCV